MRGYFWHRARKRTRVLILAMCVLIVVLTGCSEAATAPPSNQNDTVEQILNFPNVGITDIGTLDPALQPDSKSLVAVNMIFSGLVRSDNNLNVVSDQATWKISKDNKVYTFTLRPDVYFSDGTPVTAESYVYTWTRALLPALTSPIASFYEQAIVGAEEVSTGKAKTLTGVKAVNKYTLQVTLKKATPYFLQVLTTPLFFPLNKKVIDQYGQKNWPQHVEGVGVGTGPLRVKDWQHNVKMVFEPNPYYYGTKTRLKEVHMFFANDRSTAMKSYRAGQYDFMWNITPSDQATAKGVAGFTQVSQLQTDLLFFHNEMPPFDKAEVRQAFAYAINKSVLAQSIFKGSVTVAETIIPPGMPGYQQNYQGIPYDPARAKSLLQSVYPDVTKVPDITFSYPSSEMSGDEAAVLKQMWQDALGLDVKLRDVEVTAYNEETSKHLIQFGFTQWSADFPDPYDWLTLNLSSNASNNNGLWKNADFDKTVADAEKTSGDERIALYNKAEQIAISDVGWLPLNHQALAAVIPDKVHGVSLNGMGLYFGDWSDVYMQQR